LRSLFKSVSSWVALVFGRSGTSTRIQGWWPQWRREDEISVRSQWADWTEEVVFFSCFNGAQKVAQVWVCSSLVHRNFSLHVCCSFVHLICVDGVLRMFPHCIRAGELLQCTCLVAANCKTSEGAASLCFAGVSKHIVWHARSVKSPK
jgi:hypothetical protein